MAGVKQQVKVAKDEQVLAITAGAYSTGDVIGGLITIGPVGILGGSGILRHFILTDEASQDALITAHLFSAAPNEITDNNPFLLNADSVKKRIATFDIAASNYDDLAVASQAIRRDLNLDFHSPDGNLYMYLVSGGTPTYTAVTDLTIKSLIWAD